MASLSVRRLDGEVFRRLKMRAQRDGLSVEEAVRRILADAVVDVEPAGAMIRRIVGDDALRRRAKGVGEEAVVPHALRRLESAGHDLGDLRRRQREVARDAEPVGPTVSSRQGARR